MGFQDHKHYCNKGPAHQGKDLIMICLNPECDNKRLCCLTCIDEIHRKHQLISLYKFDQMLTILTKSKDSDTRDMVLRLLVEFQDKVLEVMLQHIQEMDRTLERFTKQIQKSKAKLSDVVGFAKESVNLKFTAQDFEEVYKNLDNTTVCKYLALVRQAEGQALKDPQSASKTLANAQNFLGKTLIDTEKMYTRGLEDVNNALTKLKKLLGSEGKVTKQVLFSKTNKAACLQIGQDQKLVKRIEGTGSYPIALLDEPLTEFNNQFTVTIKEQPGNKGCWLGVCVKDIVKNLNFGSCYGIGKGTWAIDQVGASHTSAYSWSHHDTNYNSQPKVGFQFVTGDTITVKVDFDKSTITFFKGSQVYEMPVQLTLGDIHGFVGCTYAGDVWVIP